MIIEDAAKPDGLRKTSLIIRCLWNIALQSSLLDIAERYSKSAIGGG
jgi:hypothetical protein